MTDSLVTVDARNLDSTHLGHEVVITTRGVITRGILTEVTHYRSRVGVSVVITDPFGHLRRIGMTITDGTRPVEVGAMSADWSRIEHLREASWRGETPTTTRDIGSRFD